MATRWQRIGDAVAEDCSTANPGPVPEDNTAQAEHDSPPGQFGPERGRARHRPIPIVAAALRPGAGTQRAIMATALCRNQRKQESSWPRSQA